MSEEAEPSPEEKMRMNLAKAGAGKVVCRLCKGGHFTAKCPYKDSLPVLDGAGKFASVGLSCSLENGTQKHPELGVMIQELAPICLPYPLPEVNMCRRVCVVLVALVEARVRV